MTYDNDRDECYDTMPCGETVDTWQEWQAHRRSCQRCRRLKEEHDADERLSDGYRVALEAQHEHEHMQRKYGGYEGPDELDLINDPRHRE